MTDISDDLNAIRDIECGLSRDEMARYYLQLATITHRDQDGHVKYQRDNKFGYPEGFPVGLDATRLILASADHRIEALRQIGK